MTQAKNDDKPVATETKPLAAADHDRVVMASRLPDGTPHQTPDFEYIGDAQFAEDAAKRQLGEQAASAIDVAERGATAAPAEGEGEPDPETAKLKAAQDKAVKAAESKASSEVKARHHGLGDRS
jgi:hypothetical protein